MKETVPASGDHPPEPKPYLLRRRRLFRSGLQAPRRRRERNIERMLATLHFAIGTDFDLMERAIGNRMVLVEEALGYLAQVVAKLLKEKP